MDRRRYLMMQNDKPKIITDGLIFHLDGKNKGVEIDNGYWTDLIGGIKFKLEDCIINFDNVEFNGTTSYGWNKNYNTPSKASSTVEMCFYDADYLLQNKVRILLMNKYNGGVAFGITPKNGKIIYDGVDIARFRKFFVQNNTVSLNNDICINNKVNLGNESIHWGYVVDSTEMATIGKRNGRSPNRDYPFKGKIYAIRIYNRKLSEEEILYNQQCDIDKYFGGHIE